MDNKEIILKAADKGFYYKDDTEIHYTADAVYVGHTCSGSFIITRNTNGKNERCFDWDKDLYFRLEDYGRTWALTQKELKLESKVWKPEVDEIYWFIDEFGISVKTKWIDTAYCKRLYAIGNCFKTKEACEFAIERLKVIKELERFAEENNKTIDWHTYQDKWYFAWYHAGNRIVILRRDTDQHNDIYFTSFELAQRALNEIGGERIKKYYLKVEE